MGPRFRSAVFALNLAAFALVLTVWASAQTTPQARLLALSKQDHTLAIVDPANLQLLARIPVGDDPHEVIAAADGPPRTSRTTALAPSTL